MKIADFVLLFFLPQHDLQSAINIEWRSRSQEGRSADGDGAVTGAIGRPKWPRHKVIAVVKGCCAKLCACGVVLVEQVIDLHEELNMRSALVSRSHVGNPVPGGLGWPQVIHAIRPVEIVLVATREGRANSKNIQLRRKL